METNRWNHRVSRTFITLTIALTTWGWGAASYAQVDEVSVQEVAVDFLAGGEDKEISPQSHVPCTGQSVTFGAGSTWELCVAAVTKFGVIITHASFRKSPFAPLITVLYDGRLGEIFVPYHPGAPRFGDISQFNFSPSPLNAGDCPFPNVIIGGTICREIEDNGVAWRNDGLVRRGTEARYWGVLDAANYNYIMEWTFRDDGTIAARAGSTGPKLGGPNDTTGHAHTFSWRLDIDLNGSAGDSAFLTKHVESGIPSSAIDSASLIATEGSRVWRATQFNTLEITDNVLQNGNGRRTSYELVPLRTGTGRHSEPFTQKDFWVSHFNAAELLANSLPAYVANVESTNQQDNVIWYTGTAHHESQMRDEDRQTVPVLWVGFQLVPHNLFEGTPFFPL